MKTLSILLSLVLAPLLLKADQNSDSLGLPGDHLDLRGVLSLFKESQSMEDFEKKINTESNQVNNLDLDEDGNVDYIKVIDHTDSGAHAIQLVVDMNEAESQTVAVLEIEQNGNESAILQIVGDEDLYGKDYIVEPSDTENDKSDESRFGNGFQAPGAIVVNVWYWPSVRFIYRPGYVVWVSPWRYRYFPPYWKPWRPVMWRVHHGRVIRYHHHCRVVRTHRVMHAHRVYHRHRVHSAAYHQRHGNGARHASPGGNNSRGRQQAPPDHGGKHHQSPTKKSSPGKASGPRRNNSVNKGTGSKGGGRRR